jgi:hypothetical protein
MVQVKTVQSKELASGQRFSPLSILCTFWRSHSFFLLGYRNWLFLLWHRFLGNLRNFKDTIVETMLNFIVSF